MKLSRIHWLLFFALLGVLALAADAEARPGGGHSYSGRSSGGSGGGGGDAGALVWLLVRLIIYYPQVGVPVAVVVVVGVVVAKRHNDGLGDWDSGESIQVAKPSDDLDDLRAFDPDFSMVLFTDFAYALFATSHRARHSEKELAKLAPYLSDAARHHLAGRLPAGEAVTAVIVGSMRLTRVAVPPNASDPEARVRVFATFESNMTVGSAGEERTHFGTETWMLARDAHAKSRPPDKAKTFNCPNCAAPFESSDNATCEYCGEVVSGGRFDWSVDSITLVRDEVRPPALTGHAPERGTRLATVHHPNFQHAFAALSAADPSVNHESLFSRVQTIFLELNKAWSSGDLGASRTFLSEGMQDYLGYWLDAYARQNLRNITENPQITNWDIARVTRDKYFDSIVVRIFANSLDYTVDLSNNKVVGGSKSTPRDYSEYWTLIRGAGVRGDGPKACPNCGGELASGMAAHCGYCGAQVRASTFDWVLSKIEQDEAYRG